MAQPSCRNIYHRLDKPAHQEIFETLVKKQGITIKRIISHGQTTDWLKQNFNEWVILLKGRARLLFKQKNVEINFKNGDYILIPKGCVHKVSWTDPKQKTIWLTVSFNRGKK